MTNYEYTSTAKFMCLQVPKFFILGGAIWMWWSIVFKWHHLEERTDLNIINTAFPVSSLFDQHKRFMF